jgi:ATP-dependent Clp protease ATP-binding subunit ClpA
VFERYSILSRQAVFVALKEAGQSGTPSICSEHLLIGIVRVHPELIRQLGIQMEPDQIRTGSEQWHAPSQPIPDSQSLPVADELGAVFGRAALNADLYQCREIRTEHLLLSLMEENCHAAQLLTECGSSKNLIAAHVASVDCSSTQLGATGSWARSLIGY